MLEVRICLVRLLRVSEDEISDRSGFDRSERLPVIDDLNRLKHAVTIYRHAVTNPIKDDPDRRGIFPGHGHSPELGYVAVPIGRSDGVLHDLEGNDIG